jgi:hypothetical protein
VDLFYVLQLFFSSVGIARRRDSYGTILGGAGTLEEALEILAANVYSEEAGSL